jgi:phosphatidate phosphatase APP1
VRPPESWRDKLGDLAGDLGRRVRHALDALERRIDRDPYYIVGYRGYGTSKRGLVLGRVLEDEGHLPPDPEHSRLRNLLAAIKRLESDPLAFAKVRTRVGDADHQIEADDEGFLRAWLAWARPVEPGWQRAELALAADSPVAAHPGIAKVLVPASDARFGVVSDLDDTVLQSEVTRLVRAVRLVLLENARTRLPFPGVAAFYRALRAGSGGPENPVFYVSKSPWNLYEVIAEFLGLQGLPEGPLLLRDLDIGVGRRTRQEHKASAIAEILATYPSLPFVLIGDSGQKDPEIYRALLHDHPGRIPAIYIRSVTPRPERVAAIGRLADEVRAAGSSLVLADDTLALARHAAEHGWIDPARLGEVAGDARADQGVTGEKVSPSNAPPPPAGPTVVVE